MKIEFSKLAEVDLSNFDFAAFEEEKVDRWLNDKCTFKHTGAYEFICHLYPDESDDWFLKNEINGNLPDRMVKTMLDARNNGAARICFYS